MESVCTQGVPQDTSLTIHEFVELTRSLLAFARSSDNANSAPKSDTLSAIPQRLWRVFRPRAVQTLLQTLSDREVHLRVIRV